MANLTRMARAFAPYAVRWGGCAAAIAVGGPTAMVVAGIAGRMFAAGDADNWDFPSQGGAKFGEAFAANLNGLITNLASDRLKSPPELGEELPLAFRHALGRSLEAIRPAILDAIPSEHEWFENWEKQFGHNEEMGLSQLAGLDEQELLDLFRENVDPQQAIWPAAERILVGLDAEARRGEREIVLKPREMDREFSRVLREKLTAQDCLPRYLSHELAHHDVAWRRVMAQSTARIQESIAPIEGFPGMLDALRAEMSSVAEATSLNTRATTDNTVATKEGTEATTDNTAALQRNNLILAQLLKQLSGPGSDSVLDGGATVDESVIEPRVATPTNLRPSTSRFVGRSQEVAHVGRLLSESRLVTLAGAGGAGKTRLAIEVARAQLDQFSDGVWIVELASKVDPEVVPGAVAEALGLREQAMKPPTEALRAHLKDKELLILLDNCEHLHDACTAVTDEVLKHCSGVSILATSREVLRGEFQETVHWVGALSLPDTEKNVSLASLSESDAVRLLEMRAREVSKFQLTEENARAVATICRRLGGIALALELAAAHLNTMSPQELAENLDDALDLLVDDKRRERKEHMSVRETIQWSYDLLTGDEQKLLRRIAVFEGSVTSEMVRSVCMPDWPKLKTRRCLDKLAQKSVINVKSSLNGKERRLYLLETVQYFGFDELEAHGETKEFETRHRDFFLNLLESVYPQLKGAPNDELLDTLEEAHDDVRVALKRCLDKHDFEPAMRIGASFWRYWEIRGLLAEGRRQLAKLIGCPPLENGQATRGRLLSGAGLLAYRQGDMTEAHDLFAQALQLEQGRDDRDEVRLAECLSDIGIATSQTGDQLKASEYYREYLSIAEQQLGARDVAVAHNNVGSAAFALGDFDEALSHLTTSYQLFSESENQSDIAYPLTKLGALFVVRNDPKTARVYLGQALTWRKKVKNYRGMADVLNWIGRADLQLEDYENAESHLDSGLHYARQVNASRETVDILDSLVVLAVARGEAGRAITLSVASDKVRASATLLRPAVWARTLEQALEKACTQMTSAQLEAARAEGSMNALEDVIKNYAYVRATSN